jgi:transcriptional regulator with XRE-family HTH domain
MELSKIIRTIRTNAGLSQERFAEEIGVTRLTVTRWESGTSFPNNIAQVGIYEVAKKYNVQFFDLIISDMPEHLTENNRTILYHASVSGIIGPIAPKSRDNCDFGKGFYMGTRASQPLTMIFSPNRNETENAVMYTLEFDLTGLNVFYVPPVTDWALLVAYSRGSMEKYAGTPLYEKYSKMLNGYDVAFGKIADDKIFTALDLFFGGFISANGVLECLTALPLGEQYVALTEKACRQIGVLKERRFSELERLCIRDVSKQNRDRAIEVADRICKSHRRDADGLFFDEIMEGEG